MSFSIHYSHTAKINSNSTTILILFYNGHILLGRCTQPKYPFSEYHPTRSFVIV